MEIRREFLPLLCPLPFGGRPAQSGAGGNQADEQMRGRILIRYVNNFYGESQISRVLRT